ncbi:MULTISPECIES: putative polysaccharide biosynthesis protein [unclassified Jeotgalibaca]|uniref:putative polysaccharide biosynthesis protein n=1 Tax=unclassified Jeotgalibaca TaxID=2621505 RepID=UPI003FCF1322
MKNEQLKTMMNGAVLLSIASLIAKVLSAVYRVPFQNMVGNTGLYVYQQIYPIYGIGMTFALSGFPVFFSKTIAQAGSEEEHRRLIRNSVLILTLFSLVLFAGIYGFAGTIAQAMGDAALMPIIRAVSWMFLFMPVLATLRGYFQGTYRMQPTAVSQVAEQLIRVGIILLAAWLFTKNGNNMYAMGAQAMSGATWGAVMATGILLVYLRKKAVPLSPSSKELTPLSFKELAYRYATEGITICLLTSMLVLFQLVDSFTLYKGLVENGIAADAAKSLKGIYDRGQPLVQLGMVVGAGFSAGFIPLMSRSHAMGQMESFHRAAKSLIRMTAAFSFAAVAGLLAILPEVNQMLFGDSSGNTVLSVYIIAIAVASIMMAYHSIFQSFNQYALTLVALALGLSVKFIANTIFVPWWDTLGASVATIAGLLAMVIFMNVQLPLPLRNVWKRDRFLVKLMGGAGILYIGATVTKHLLWLLLEPGRTNATVVALVTVGVGVILFFIYIVRFQLFTTREWLSIPYGKKLMKKLVNKRGTSDGKDKN